MAWAIKWKSKNKLDGVTERLLGTYYGSPSVEFSGCPALLFKTRQQARDFIKDRFGYIKSRPDLKSEPHGWTMPTPIKVEVQVLAVN